MYDFDCKVHVYEDATDFGDGLILDLDDGDDNDDNGVRQMSLGKIISNEWLWGDVLVCVLLVCSSFPAPDILYKSVTELNLSWVLDILRGIGPASHCHTTAYAMQALLLPSICSNDYDFLRMKTLVAAAILLIDWALVTLYDAAETDLFIWFNIAMSIFLFSFKTLSLHIAESDRNRLLEPEQETATERICRVSYDELFMLAGFAAYTQLDKYRLPVVPSICCLHMAVVGVASGISLLATIINQDSGSEKDPMAFKV